MSISEDKRQEILELLANGKITVASAAEMLSGAGQSEPAPEKESAPKPDLDDLIKVEPDPALKETRSETKQRPSWLRVRVSDLKSGRNKVTVNIPMRLMRFGLAVGSRFSPDLDGLDWDELDHLLTSERGMLVDVQDEEDGEHVQIFVD